MDSVLEQAKQMELKFKNKIIELEKELEYESLRANQYEAKFREALLDNNNAQSDQNLLQTLAQKEKQLAMVRRELLEANRKNCSSPNDNLISQNQELRNIVEELKNAAVAAIMEKQSEIEELKTRLEDTEMADQIYVLSQRNQELQAKIIKLNEEFSEQISILNRKVSEEREHFADKLVELQKEHSYEQNAKYELLKKTENLQGNLENMERVINQFQTKIIELEQQKSTFKINQAQLQHKHKVEVQSLQNDIKILSKQLEQKNQQISSLTKTVESQKSEIESASQEKQELERKLKIKNRKQNPKQNQSIYQSFEGFSQKANLYTSFARPQYTNFTVKQSFIGNPMKLSEISQIQIGQIQNFTQLMEGQIAETEEPKPLEQKPVTQNNKAESGEVKALMQQIDRLNSQIDQLTQDLQNQRRGKLELKQKLNKEQSLYKIDKESLRQHIFKLENALLIEKLQNAQKLQSNREIRQYQRKMYEQQIAKLRNELDSPKKKKGFFK